MGSKYFDEIGFLLLSKYGFLASLDLSLFSSSGCLGSGSIDLGRSTISFFLPGSLAGVADRAGPEGTNFKRSSSFISYFLAADDAVARQIGPLTLSDGISTNLIFGHSAFWNMRTNFWILSYISMSYS